MFDTAETILVSIDILAGMLQSMTVHKKGWLNRQKDFSNATELADYLASKGLPSVKRMRLLENWSWSVARQDTIFRMYHLRPIRLFRLLFKQIFMMPCPPKLLSVVEIPLAGQVLIDCRPVESAKEEIQNAKSL